MKTDRGSVYKSRWFDPVGVHITWIWLSVEKLPSIDLLDASA
jgi:hypothetical protein